MPALERLEFWTDLEVAGGVRRAVIGQWLGCDEEQTLEGDNTMTLTLHGENAALHTLDTPAGESNAAPGAVLRAVLASGEVVERRIESVQEQDDRGDVRVVIVARGMLHELSLRGLCYRANADGSRSYHFRASALTLAQHFANYIVPALTEAGAEWLGYLGVVDYDAPVTVVYDKDTPLGALRKLCAATPSGLELSVRMDPATKHYLVDLRQQVGAGARLVRVRAGAGLLRTGLGYSARDVVTRVYGFGSADAEYGVASLAKNAWLIDSIRGKEELNAFWVHLADPGGGPGPIAYDHQYGTTPEGQHQLVPLEQNPPWTAQLPSYYVLDATAATGELLVQRYAGGEDVGGNNYFTLRHGMQSLAYVDRPSPGQLGLRVGYIERPEVPAVVNYVDNPAGRVPDPARGNLPRYWEAMAQGLPTSAGVTLGLETGAAYYRTGGRSVRASFSSMESYLSIQGRAGGYVKDGRLSYFADLFTVQGQVEVQLRVTWTQRDSYGNVVWGGLIYPRDYPSHTQPGAPVPDAASQRYYTWERIGVDGAHNCLTYPASAMWVCIVPKMVPSEVIVDCAQITRTRSNREFVEGSGSNLLLQTANERLLRYSDLDVEVSADTLDLGSVDDVRFPYQEYVMGGGIELVNDRLARSISTRVLGWRRDWLHREQLGLTVASGRSNLARVVAQRMPGDPAPGV